MKYWLRHANDRSTVFYPNRENNLTPRWLRNVQPNTVIHQRPDGIHSVPIISRRATRVAPHSFAPSIPAARCLSSGWNIRLPPPPRRVKIDEVSVGKIFHQREKSTRNKRLLSFPKLRKSLPGVLSPLPQLTFNSWLSRGLKYVFFYGTQSWGATLETVFLIPGSVELSKNNHNHVIL